MGKLSYLIMNIVGYVPLFVGAYLLFRKQIARNRRFITLGFLLGICYFLVVDPWAVLWRAWEYNYRMTLGPFFGPTVAEEMLWAALAFSFAAIMVAVLAEAEEKGRRFTDIFRNK